MQNSIAKDSAENKKDDWHWQMRARLDSPVKLRAWLKERGLYKQVSPVTLSKLEDWEKKQALWEQHFRFAVSPYYLELVDWSDPGCPILAQFLPSLLEFVQQSLGPGKYKEDSRRGAKSTKAEAINWDPLAEEECMPVRGLSHRYPDRVLWYLSHSCAVYCRFCMRKRKVSQPESAPTRADWEAILSYIRQHTEIKEVILSGGDPLSLEDKHLAYILEKLRCIKHLYSIRIHTRMPVTLPMRIDKALAELFGHFYPITVVTHFNHRKELTAQSKKAIRLLRMSGVDVLNQAVLLRDINDNLKAQEELNLDLLAAGVRPYYLHRCDEIPGLDHFRVPVAKGVSILRKLRGRNPGISLPRYVVDLPGGGGKVPLEPSYLLESEGNFLNDKSDKKNALGKKTYYLQNWAAKLFAIHE